MTHFPRKYIHDYFNSMEENLRGDLEVALKMLMVAMRNIYLVITRYIFIK